MPVIQLHTSHCNLLDYLLFWFVFGWVDNYKLQHMYRWAELVFVAFMKNLSKNQWLVELLIGSSLDKSFSFSVITRMTYEFLHSSGSGRRGVSHQCDWVMAETM